MDRTPVLEHLFDAEIEVGKPTLVGHDERHGRRQIVPIAGGTVSGELHGRILPDGADCQCIAADGTVQIHARYGVALEDGNSLFIDVQGSRVVDEEYAAEAAQGMVIDPRHIYFVTGCHIESFGETYRWLERVFLLADSTKLPGRVIQRFYRVSYPEAE